MDNHGVSARTTRKTTASGWNNCPDCVRGKLSRLARRESRGPNDKFANHAHVEYKTSVFLIR